MHTHTHTGDDDDDGEEEEEYEEESVDMAGVEGGEEGKMAESEGGTREPSVSVPEAKPEAEVKPLAITSTAGAVTQQHQVAVGSELGVGLHNTQRLVIVVTTDDKVLPLLDPVCCLLSAVCCLLTAVYLLIACCLLSVACCLLPAVCCLLSAICCQLSAVYCLPVCYLLFAVCCLVVVVITVDELLIQN
jgi:hypothetical protein